MRKLLIIMALLTSSAWAGWRDKDIFPFHAFVWRGQVIRQLSGLHQAMTQIDNRIDVRALHAAMAQTNADPDFFIGYALAEFGRDWEKAEELFAVVHPIWGPAREARKVPVAVMIIIGHLGRLGTPKERLPTDRAILTSLPPDALVSILSQLEKLDTMNEMEWIKILEHHRTHCSGIISGPLH